MFIGSPKEIKAQEYRVGLVPSSVRELRRHGHRVFIEKNAGEGIGISDEDYRAAGATICDTAKIVYEKAELIVKVKEPQKAELAMLREGQTLFTFLHLAPDHKLTQGLMDSGCTAIAYETVTNAQGGLPLLAPMSEVAGRMSIQVGAYALQKSNGGSGVLLSGVPGVAPGNIVIIGGGVVGTNAVRMALGEHANVALLDTSIARLNELDLQFGTTLNTIYSTQESIEEYVRKADLVVGAVLVPGAESPIVISRDLVKKMRKGSVIVDVAIDQGGCVETSRPTSHDDPVYIVDEVVHYCVSNMPGGVPRTATFALNNATLPYIVELANKGIQTALLENVHLLNGLNVYKGQVTYAAVAEAMNVSYIEPRNALNN